MELEMFVLDIQIRSESRSEQMVLRNIETSFFYYLKGKLF